MPNGFHGSKKKWDRIESPLRTLDAELQEYAKRFGMTLSKNYHSWPERSLTWSDGLDRKIQISRESEESATYTIGVAAWRKGADGYFVRQDTIADGALIDYVQSHLLELLDMGRIMVNSWSEVDLPPSGKQ